MTFECLHYCNGSQFAMFLYKKYDLVIWSMWKECCAVLCSAAQFLCYKNLFVCLLPEKCAGVLWKSNSINSFSKSSKTSIRASVLSSSLSLSLSLSVFAWLSSSNECNEIESIEHYSLSIELSECLWRMLSQTPFDYSTQSVVHWLQKVCGML